MDEEIKKPGAFDEDVKKPGMFAGIAGWLREFKSEIKKIVWPDRKQVVNNTIVVIVSILLIGAFVCLLDLGFEQARMFLIQLAA